MVTLSRRVRLRCGPMGESGAPAFLSTSATMGTVELTGLLMTAIQALGQCWAMPSARPATMSAQGGADRNWCRSARFCAPSSCPVRAGVPAHEGGYPRHRKPSLISLRRKKQT